MPGDLSEACGYLEENRSHEYLFCMQWRVHDTHWEEHHSSVLTVLDRNGSRNRLTPEYKDTTSFGLISKFTNSRYMNVLRPSNSPNTWRISCVSNAILEKYYARTLPALHLHLRDCNSKFGGIRTLMSFLSCTSFYRNFRTSRPMFSYDGCSLLNTATTTRRCSIIIRWCSGAR